MLWRLWTRVWLLTLSLTFQGTFVCSGVLVHAQRCLPIFRNACPCSGMHFHHQECFTVLKSACPCSRMLCVLRNAFLCSGFFWGIRGLVPWASLPPLLEACLLPHHQIWALDYQKWWEHGDMTSGRSLPAIWINTRSVFLNLGTGILLQRRIWAIFCLFCFLQLKRGHTSSAVDLLFAECWQGNIYPIPP